jgi:hypothetical protein
VFDVEDQETGKQESLGTTSRAEAASMVNARNEANRQPHLKLQIAKAYLAGTDSGVASRTWQNALTLTGMTKPLLTRQKTGSLAMIHFGDEIAAILRSLPKDGYLFPYLQKVRCGDRATECRQRCDRLELASLSALAGNQRSLVPDGQPVVTEIEVTEIAAPDKQPQTDKG